jgi:hypothetical protein
MAHAAHDTHDTAHGHDSHGAHGHAAAVTDDGTAGGPLGWPLALLVGVAYLAGALWAFMAH